MAKKDTAFIAATIIVALSLIGYINHQDIQRCVDLGNSVEACQRAFNR